MARETLRVMEQSVLLAAAAIYMDVSRDSANLEVQNNVRVLQRTLTDTRNRFAVGQVTDTDVAQSEAQLAAAEASLHGVESTLTTTRANYRRIIGVDPGNLAPASSVERMAPATLSAAIAAGAAENPSVIAALYGVDVAQLQVKIAEGALFPTLAAQYNVQYGVFPQLLTPHQFTDTVMLNLSAPIYQGGEPAAAERRRRPRPNARQRRSVLGSAASREGADRSGPAPERCGRARAHRRAQRGAGRPADHPGCARCAFTCGLLV
jgi:outer membrane protein